MRKSVPKTPYYFPSQRIHFERDDPCSATDVLIINDPKIDDYS